MLSSFRTLQKSPSCRKRATITELHVFSTIWFHTYFGRRSPFFQVVSFLPSHWKNRPYLRESTPLRITLLSPIPQSLVLPLSKDKIFAQSFPWCGDGAKNISKDIPRPTRETNQKEVLKRCPRTLAISTASLSLSSLVSAAGVQKRWRKKNAAFNVFSDLEGLEAITFPQTCTLVGEAHDYSFNH